MGNAVVAQSEALGEPSSPTQAQSDATAIIHVIERAALNPSIDLDKMQRLIEMQERILARNAKAAFDAAFALMQERLPIIDEKGVHDGTKKSYAKWDDINEAIKPILGAHGFSLRFRIQQAPGHVSVTGILSHRDGHSDETTITLPVDVSGQKNAVQAIGSSQSYGQRYAAKALLSLSSRVSDDDDGRATGDGGAISDEQVAALQSLIVEVGADIPKFCAYMKVSAVEDIPAKHFDRAVKALEAKRAKA